MMSRIGQSLLDTKVLVLLNILVARMSFLPSTFRETWATGWPEILIDHQSNQPLKPFAEGFQGLPSMPLIKLGSSLPPASRRDPYRGCTGLSHPRTSIADRFLFDVLGPFRL